MLISLPTNELTSPEMKRILLTFAVMLSVLAAASAQNVVIGEKLPETRFRKWLMDLQPDAADYTCMVFYHSESSLCRRCLDRVKTLVSKYGTKLNVIIVTKEDYDTAGVTLTEHLGDRVAVAFDDGGRTFRYFGVKFIPFCVICDRKRRAVWCGNGITLTENITDRIITGQ